MYLKLFGMRIIFKDLKILRHLFTNVLKYFHFNNSLIFISFALASSKAFFVCNPNPLIQPF